MPNESKMISLLLNYRNGRRFSQSKVLNTGCRLPWARRGDGGASGGGGPDLAARAQRAAHFSCAAGAKILPRGHQKTNFSMKKRDQTCPRKVAFRGASRLLFASRTRELSSLLWSPAALLLLLLHWLLLRACQQGCCRAFCTRDAPGDVT